MKKILVIEDEEDLNQTLSFNLENEGYKVTSALKGSEALEILENASPPDLVILDLMLPDMPGLDICRHIRSKDNLKNISVIIVTAKGEEVDLEAHEVDGKFTIFDFGAPWCGPCHVAEKLLRDYLSDHPDVALRAVVLDAQDAKTSFDMPVVAQHLQTAPGLPYFILVNPKGKTIARGVDPARILKKIDKKR